jgi:manganese-dependent inorganic pyrophosphatase
VVAGEEGEIGGRVWAHSMDSVFALMVTDILARGTELLVTGDRGPLERAFGRPVRDGVVSMPGVMSRKKQVAPKLLAR